MPSDVLSVMVLQPQRAAGGVEPVWAATVAAADSVARASVTADSIAAARAAGAPGRPILAESSTVVTSRAVPATPNAVVGGAAAGAVNANPDSVAAAARARARRIARRDSLRADSIRRAETAAPRVDSTRPATTTPAADTVRPAPPSPPER
jgi:hypothetical protein